jgi:hypothetical protein
MLLMHKMTSEFVEDEDRMRLTGELKEGGTVVIWLTQRLLTRLLPHLFKWLETQSGNNLPAELVLSFAQQAARAELSPEPPVKSDQNTQMWLAHAVDIMAEPAGLRLRFRSLQQEQAGVSLQPQQLQQWFSILHELWQRAEWPTNLWPEWIVSSDQTKASKLRIPLH